MISRRDFLKLGGVVLLGSLLPDTATVNAESPPLIIEHGSRYRSYIAITFDDCYHRDELLQIESLLDQHPQHKVTFFPVGKAIEVTHAQDPKLWSRLLSKGHEIGYHSYQHDNFWLMLRASASLDYAQWQTALSSAIGFLPKIRYARPPYGNVSSSFQYLCQQNNLIIALWSASWGGPVEKAMQAMQNSENGDIVLMHITAQDLINTQAAMQYLQTARKQSLTLTDLIYRSQIFRSHECRQLIDQCMK